MSIKVGLPSIYIRDGNYKPFIRVGDYIKVCLFFDDFISKVSLGNKKFIKNINLNKYEFIGEIIHIRKLYKPNIIVISSQDIIFFAVVEDNHDFKVGDNVFGNGKINLDPYYWFETLDNDSNFDIYDCYEITRIMLVKYEKHVETLYKNVTHVLRDDKFPSIEYIDSISKYFHDFSVDFILSLEKEINVTKDSLPYLSID